MEKYTAISCLVTVAKILSKKVAAEDIQRIYNGIHEPDETAKLIAAARKLGIKSKHMKLEPDGLTKISQPAIAVMNHGYSVILKVTDSKVIILNSCEEKPEAVSFEEFAEQWSGTVFLVKNSISLETLARKFNLDWFGPVIANFKLYLGEVVVASFFLQLFGLVTPLFTQVIMDKVIIHKGEATLDVLAFALVIFAIFQLVLGMLRTYISTHTTNKIDVILAARLFRHIVRLPLRYFETRRVGDILMRIAGLNSVREFFTGSTISVMLDAMFSIVFIAVMAHYSLVLTGVALLAIPVYLAQNLIATPLYQKRIEQVWTTGAENNAFMVESVTGIQTIKALAIEPQLNHRWEQIISRYIAANFSAGVFNLGITNAGQLIQKISAVSVLWVGGHLVMEGVMTVGQLVAFQMLANQTNAPILRLVGMWQTIQKTALAVNRMQDIIHNPLEPAAAAAMPKTSAPVKGDIVFDDVSFKYFIDTLPILEKVSLRIPAGARVGIVGPSGSGKSTLIKLIQRLYVPDSGRVLIDGADLAQINPGWIRRQIGIILQDNYLFSGSVRDNIAAARPAAPMEEVIKAAKAAAAHEFILELPEGYDTDVGERGSFLSGGQRQRIAIARTLLVNPRILIMDEATSALDYEAEYHVLENIRRQFSGRTVILIAHRLSTVQKCDFIIVVDHGSIAELGSHQALLSQKGLYYNLYRQQEE